MILLRRTQYLAPSPPTGPVFHAATYLHRSPGWSHARQFARWNRDVERQLANTPGALAYSLQRPLLGRDAWTLSLWADRPSMIEFVRTGAHRSAAEWLRVAEQNVGKFTQWEAPQPSLRWSEAFERLGMPSPRGRVLEAPTPVPAGWRAALR